MSLQPDPSKAPDGRDKGNNYGHTSEIRSALSAKPGDKSEQDHLNVTFSGAIRAPSPDPSLISIDDLNNIRIERNPDYVPGYANGRHAPQASAPPRTWREKTRAFWVLNKGLALVMMSLIFGTLMNVTTRLLEVEGNHGNGYHPFQILFARMSITVVFSSIYMWRSKIEDFPFGMREVRPLLIARGLTGFFGVFGMYYSLLYLPLADATVITFLAPPLGNWACAYFINEPFTRMEQIAAYVSFFGVILIARPVSLFSAMSHSEPATLPASGNADILPTPKNSTSHPLASDYDSVTPAQRAAAVGVAMIGVLGATGAYTTIRWIGKRAHPLISVNYFATWCTLVSIVMMLAVPSIGFLLPSGLKDWCYLIFLGICGFVMQFLLTAGLAYEKSSRATNMVYTQMLFALAFDKMVFGVTPSALSIVGSSLILGSAIYVAMHKVDTKPDQDVRGRDFGAEEVGLMSPDIMGELGEEGDVDIQLRSLRV